MRPCKVCHRLPCICAHPVPAPPTRTEEPGLNSLRENLLEAANTMSSAVSALHAHALSVEVERDRLREQIETMRTYIDECKDHGNTWGVRVKFTELFPPERP